MKRSAIRVLLTGQPRGVGSRVTSSAVLRVQLDTTTTLRSSTYLDQVYLIVPVISQVGDTVVWPANAPTPELIPADVLQLATEARNGHPIVMNHPQDPSTGEYISANSPEVLERYAFGYYFNSGYSDGRVKGEMWISKDRAAALPDETLRAQALDAFERITSGSMVEVSEGNYVVIEDEEGEHEGVKYSGRWVLAIPDHLAILPEGVEGACSIANQGCGAPRVNAKKADKGDLRPLSAPKVHEPPHNLGQRPEEVSANENVPRTESIRQPTVPEVSPMKKPNPFVRLLSAVSSVFRTDQFASQIGYALAEAIAEAEPAFYYIHDYDPDKGVVIYCTLVSYPDYDSERTYWQRTFMRNSDGTVTLNDDAIEGQIGEPPFVPKADSDSTDATLTANSDTTAGEAPCSCHKGEMTPMAFNRKEAIPRIAARHKLDVKVLETADDTVLEKLDDPNTASTRPADPTVPPNTGPDPHPDPRPADPLVEVPVKVEATGVTLEQIQALIAPITTQLASIAPIVAQAQSAENERRTSLITSLVAASKFSEEQLKAMATDHLVTMADSLGVLASTASAPVFDYTGSRVLASGSGSGANNAAPPIPDVMASIRAARGSRTKDKDTN